MGIFSRSWEITKLSFGVIKKDKEMLLFPIFAGIFSVLFMVAMVFPTIITSLLENQKTTSGTMELVIIFLTYLGLAFIATFFNVCVVYTTKTRFEGGNATFFQSIGYAFSKIHLIFSWSLVAATVGLILRIIDRMAEKMGQAGKIVVNILTSLLGMVWSIITIFVVPAMVYNNLGPFAAIKKSIQALKKTWGESLVRHFGLGLMQFLFILIGLIILVPLGILIAPMGLTPLLIVIGVGIIYLVLVLLTFSVANSVFSTALFVYANTGQIPSGFNQEVMQNAFMPKGARVQNMPL